MVQRRRHGRFHAAKPSHFKHPRSYRIICSGCGKEVVTQVNPPEDKKLLCLGCFTKSGISKQAT